MKPIEFPQSNLLLKSNGPNVNDLIAGRAIDSTGTQCIVAKFELDKEEIERIAKIGCIYLSIQGGGWPPVLLSTLDPYQELGYTELSPSGIPDYVPYKDQIEEMVIKIYFKGRKVGKQYIQDFLGYLNESMPVNFEAIGKRFEYRLKKDKVLISVQLQEMELMFKNNLDIEDTFKKIWDERRKPKLKMNGKSRN